MNNRTLVKIACDKNGIFVRTISRDRKSPHSFFISRGMIDDFNDLTSAVVTVSDCGSFAQIWRDVWKDTIHIRFSWLRSDGIRLSGWEETVIVPFYDLMAINQGEQGDTLNLLSLEKRSCPKLVFQSSRNLHAAVTNRRVRRKLSKALRDNFHWHGTDQIVFYDDFEPYSFFFRESRQGRAGICGGLILHDREDLSKAHYSVHT